jgi:hypothetical protein
MAGKSKITIATLVNLGAPKLAALMLAEAAGNKKLKQAIELANLRRIRSCSTSRSPEGFTPHRLRERHVRMLAEHDQRFTQCHIGRGCAVHGNVMKTIFVAQE